jgi:hypothetical protein
MRKIHGASAPISSIIVLAQRQLQRNKSESSSFRNRPICVCRSQDTGQQDVVTITETVKLHVKQSSEATFCLETTTYIALAKCPFKQICGLLGYYAASCGNCLPMFRDNISVPSSRVKSPSRKSLKFKVQWKNLTLLTSSYGFRN